MDRVWARVLAGAIAAFFSFYPFPATAQIKIPGIGNKGKQTQPAVRVNKNETRDLKV